MAEAELTPGESPADEAGAARQPALKRGLWWIGRLLGAAFLASAAGAVPILLDHHVSGWLTGKVEVESAADAVAQLIMLIGFATPFAGFGYGFLPAFAVGLLLLAAAVRNEGARHVALWATAGVGVAWFAVSTAIEEIDILAWAMVILGGAAGGVILRRLLSPSGRFDEGSNRPEKPSSRERYGYAILSGIWPIGILALAYTAGGGGLEPLFLAIDALLLLAVALIVTGRRRRRELAGQAAMPSG